MAKKVLYVAIDKKSNKVFKFNNWDECKETVSGNDFAYKGFSKNELDKVDEFIKLNTLAINENNFDANIKDAIYIYVDGSRRCDNKNNCTAYSYGCCVVKNGNIIAEFSKRFDDKYNHMFQIMGELRGALKALEYAKENQIKEIFLIYDYVGVEKFATGAWESKEEVIKQYHKTMQDYMETININFVKVKSHVKEKDIIHTFNDRADELANDVLNIF